ncbi:MAG: alpha/beta hydrolase [Planctomycetaceae bacterium]|nr:alpha/beta hydrolase [Planctomycetaceae bacterium]
MSEISLQGWRGPFLFWLRVLILSLVCSPVVVGQELPPLPSPSASPLIGQFDGVTPTPATISAEAGAVLPAPVAIDSVDHNFIACPTPCYWIVSSRCSVQNIHESGRWGLDVYQRTPDGCLSQSNVSTLASQLVPGMPVCIFSHGSFVQWESQCKEAGQAYAAFRSACPNMPVQMIFFTWPSDGPYTYLLPVDASIRGVRAEFNGFHLSYLMSQIPETCPVCLIGHSHGTRVVLSALHLAGGGDIQGHVFTGSIGNRRVRAVLAAAATDHFWLNPGNRYGCALNRVECLLNLQNRRDFPLAFYSFSHPFAGGALARRGFTNRDINRIGGYNASKIRQCDVTAELGPDHLWPQYFGNREIVSAMLPYIYFQ